MLRSAIIDRIKLMEHFSWRVKAPWILNLCHLIQKIATCWVFALVMQLKTYLKLFKSKDLTMSDYLSYQDFINKVPKKLFKRNKKGDLANLDDLVNVLEYDGVVPKD